MSEIKLRDYQQATIDAVYDHFRDGKKRVIVQSATGSGKTIIYCHIAKDFSKYGKVIIVMTGRELVLQGSRSLHKVGVPHSIIMAGNKNYNKRRSVQICSIDTLNSRNMYPFNNEKTLIILDESHRCTPRAKKYVKLLNEYSNSFVVGFTATPFSDNSLFDCIVNKKSPKELMQEGHLVPIRAFVPNIIDVSKVRIKSTGEFDEKELFEAVAKKAVIGDIVKDWKKYGKNKKTLVFGVNIEHSKILCSAFNNAGIKAEHVDGTTPQKKREEVYNRVRRGETLVLCNVGVLTTGFDMPEIEVLCFARPTNSLILYLQICGRLLRTHKGKTEGLLLDNAANILRHGSPYKDRQVSMKRTTMNKDPKDLTLRQCKECFFVFPVNENECPNCGYKNPPVKIDIKTAPGELLELMLTDEEIEQLKISQFISSYYKLKFIQKTRGLYPQFAVQKLKAQFGSDFFNKYKQRINL